MVKKSTIGKIQLWIGIVLLVLSIIAIPYANKIGKDNLDDRLKQMNFNLNELKKSEVYLNSSNATQRMLISDTMSLNFNDYYFIAQSLFNFWLMCVLTIILSLLFITQGLINISKFDKNG